MTKDEKTALIHIVKNGDDRNLRAKKWGAVKRSLYQAGFLDRRLNDWAWIPTDAGTKAVGRLLILNMRRC